MRNPVRSLTKRLVRLRRFPMLARRRGATFLLDPRNWIDNRLAAGAPFENAQIDRASALIRQHGLNVFIDAGANIGLYTVLIGSLPEIARVVAIEPVRRNFNQLLGNVFANRLDHKVEAFRVALGDAEAELSIHVDPASTGVSRFDLSTAARDTSVFSQSEQVRIARLDDLLPLAGQRIFLKIDVEGHAIPALAGMARLLAGNTIIMQVELLDADRSSVIAALDAQGLHMIDEIEGDGYFMKGA